MGDIVLMPDVICIVADVYSSCEPNTIAYVSVSVCLPDLDSRLAYPRQRPRL